MPRNRGARGTGSVIVYHIRCHPPQRKAATAQPHASDVACRVLAGADPAGRARGLTRPGYGSAAPSSRRFLANRTTSIPPIPAARSASPTLAAAGTVPPAPTQGEPVLGA